MKNMVKEVFTLTFIALVCSTLIYLTYRLIGGIS